MKLLRRLAVDVICWLKQWGPITHAVCYVELDGSREVDFRLRKRRADAWADWCKRDGCSDVQIHPLYSEHEIIAIRMGQVEMKPAREHDLIQRLDYNNREPQ